MVSLQQFIRRYTSVSVVIDALARRELALLDPQNWDDRNDRYFMELYKRQRGIQGLYGLCAAHCSETYHHWRVFTAGSDGACIELKRSPLEKALAGQPGVRFGEVDYLMLGGAEKLTKDDVTRLPFVKRAGFAPEDEYRIIAESDEVQRSTFAIEFKLSWVNKIYLNPWMPDSIADSVRATLKLVDGCSNIQITKSRLIDSARWKRAGDQVAGRKRPTSKLKLKLPS